MKSQSHGKTKSSEVKMKIYCSMIDHDDNK